MADANRDEAVFFLSKDGAAFWKLRVTYREVEVIFRFPRNGQGQDELKNLMGSLPRIVGFAFHQIEVKEAMKDIDAEIEGLLGDAE